MSKTDGTLALAPKTNSPEQPTYPDLNADAVAAYLKAHPEFFLDQDDLVAEITLPDVPPPIASLPHRQLAIWRQRQQKLERRLSQLLKTAEENAQHDARMHEFVLRLLPLVRSGIAIETFLELLKDTFSVEVARFHPWNTISNKDKTAFAYLIESGYPSCGRMTDEQRRIAFGEDEQLIKSAALIPVIDHRGQNLGLLALGRKAADGFRPDQGSVFLKQLAELLAASLLTDATS